MFFFFFSVLKVFLGVLFCFLSSLFFSPGIPWITRFGLLLRWSKDLCKAIAATMPSMDARSPSLGVLELLTYSLSDSNASTFSE